MTTAWATRCWGVALALGLSLPCARMSAAPQGLPVPASAHAQAQAPEKDTDAPPPAPSAPQDPAAEIPAPGPAAPAPPAEPAPSPDAGPPYAVAWSVPIEADGDLSLRFTPSSLILAGASAPVQARALDDGRLLWSAAHVADQPPAAGEGLVVSIHDGRLEAVDEATGEARWNVELGGPTHGPVIRTGRVLVSSATDLRAYRLADGALLWSGDAGAAPLTAPATSESAVILALEGNMLAAFDLVDGRPFWREQAEITPTAMVAAGERLYISAAEGFACAYKLAHGRKDWCFPVRVRPIGSPAVDDRYVYFAFLDNMVHVFDRQSGRRYHTPSLGSLPSAGPTLTGTHVAVPVVTGEFVLLDIANQLTPVRISTPTPSEMPSTKVSAVSSDGSLLAMVTASPTGRALVCFKRRATDPPTDVPEGPAAEPPVSGR